MRIVCDFDGTISLGDTTDVVLGALASRHWRRLEAQWLRGEISAADCMRRQIGLIPADIAALDAVLAKVELDPGFGRFAAWCAAEAVRLSIVSDGVDYFIGKVLSRHGLGGIDVIANELHDNGVRLRLAQPWRREGCAGGSGVCKCKVASVDIEDEAPLVYVGDGRSDFCVSHRADVLFAKGSLADYAAARGQVYHPFESFDDVAAVVARLRRDAADTSPRQAI